MKLFQGPSRVVIFGVLLLVTGCQQKVADPRDPRFIVAENAHWQITRAELDHAVDIFLYEHLSNRGQAGADAVAKIETSLLDKMVLTRLLLARAASMPPQDTTQEEAEAFHAFEGHFPSEGEFEQQLKATGSTVDDLKKRIHEQILIKRLIEAKAFQDVVPTDREVGDFYAANPALFATPPKVRASRILVLTDSKDSAAQKAKERQTIDQARARVIKGDDFAEVARRVSQDRYSASKGGDIGFFQMGENERPFDDMAFHTGAGQVSPVFQTMVGYWILKVTGTQPGGATPFAEAKASIVKRLGQQKKEKAAEIYFEKVKGEDHVVYHSLPAAQPPSEQSSAMTNAAPSSHN